MHPAPAAGAAANDKCVHLCCPRATTGAAEPDWPMKNTPAWLPSACPPAHMPASQAHCHGLFASIIAPDGDAGGARWVGIWREGQVTGGVEHLGGPPRVAAHLGPHHLACTQPASHPSSPPHALSACTTRQLVEGMGPAQRAHVGSRQEATWVGAGRRAGTDREGPSMRPPAWRSH